MVRRRRWTLDNNPTPFLVIEGGLQLILCGFTWLVSGATLTCCFYGNSLHGPCNKQIRLTRSPGQSQSGFPAIIMGFRTNSFPPGSRQVQCLQRQIELMFIASQWRNVLSGYFNPLTHSTSVRPPNQRRR